LAHEMAHFSGGDTQASAALGPRLHAYANYMEALHGTLVSRLAYYVLNLFREAFQLALSRSSREREFAADAAAAQLTSSGAIARALVRVGAYASYRNTVEDNLFEQNAVHDGQLRLADRIAAGLPGFARTEEFSAAMAHADTPHPFDSHPPLQQRMEHVGAVIAPADFEALVLSPPQQTWIDFIDDADAIEAPMWQQYEVAFAAQHELNLAYRYEPANDAERALVLRYFPDVVFELKKGAALRVTYVGVEAPGGSFAWDQFHGFKYSDGGFGISDSLTISHPEKSKLGGHKTSRLKIPIASKERDRFRAALGQYWGRHQLMRQMQRSWS